ncbi:hypothetical protein Sjap_025839 [Stephania japonica]|uniref:Uncharacterized protein n=1 Tax=Stephania japonica TaxID=461633 RepID=A0AAP0E5K6_9MAGN
MAWEDRYLDLIFVPGGLLIMFVYHIHLLYRILKQPHTTVIGYENHNKEAWVERLMNEADVPHAGIALQVISSNSSAATVLASLSISLSSLIAALAGTFTNSKILETIVYGDKSLTIAVIKYVSLISCFLIAFACFVQAARYFVHSNFLISTPNTIVPLKYVQQDVVKAGNYWSAGIRALYFAIVLLLWIFGPIPMFVASVIMVSALSVLDSNSCPMHDYGNVRHSRWNRKSADLKLITHQTGQDGTTNMKTVK